MRDAFRLFWVWAAMVVAGSAASAETLFLEPAPDTATARVLFLPEDRARLDDAPAADEARIVVTGAYSSGDAFRPEGFTIRAGEPTRPFPQGWDGLLIVDAEGRARIHYLGRVSHGGRAFDLRDAESRARFLDVARAEGLSAVQSHLLIVDGVLDVRPREDAPRHRRRILFQLADGRIGLYDTDPEAMTLYDAARALDAAHAPRMAFNLDMGTYDFCERQAAGARERCGRLSRASIDDRLTNLIELTIGPR